MASPQEILPREVLQKIQDDQSLQLLKAVGTVRKKKKESEKEEAKKLLSFFSLY